MRESPEWSEARSMKYIHGAHFNLELSRLDDRLLSTHSEANDPFESYSGVAALFNADLFAADPNYAPREDWVVKPPEEIIHRE